MKNRIFIATDVIGMKGSVHVKAMFKPTPVQQVSLGFWCPATLQATSLLWLTLPQLYCSPDPGKRKTEHPIPRNSRIHTAEGPNPKSLHRKCNLEH